MAKLRVGEAELEYELIDCCEAWKPGKLPVLFLHGLGGDRTNWIYQVAALCGRRPTLTVDMRGHGLSSSPAGEWSMVDFARDVGRLLRGLGVERAHVVGISFGGMVAQQLALDFPLAVASLTLVGTACRIPGGSAAAGATALQAIESSPMREVARERITNAFSDDVDPEMLAFFIERVAANDKQDYLRTARAAMGFSVRERLGEIAAPTLVVVGEKDRVLPPVFSSEIAATVRGAAMEQIEAAGHICMFEKPGAFNAVLEGFLARLGE